MDVMTHQYFAEIPQFNNLDIGEESKNNQIQVGNKTNNPNLLINNSFSDNYKKEKSGKNVLIKDKSETNLQSEEGMEHPQGKNIIQSNKNLRQNTENELCSDNLTNNDSERIIPKSVFMRNPFVSGENKSKD